MLVPIGLGLLAVGYLFYQQFDIEKFREIEWTGRAFAWIGLAFLLLLLRHFFYAYRLKVLTGGDFFSWKKCLELIVIWEFSGALTPTSKGGPFVMLFVLTQEKVSAGKTAAAIFYTMICDSGFFVLTLPILLAIYGPPMMYPGYDLLFRSKPRVECDVCDLRDDGDVLAVAHVFCVFETAIRQNLV
jgi:hypothetical protein